MTHLPRPTVNGLCTVCGLSEFTLAQDLTEYSPCLWDADSATFVTTYSHEESSMADDAVRFFCAACGEPHAVPEDLP